MDYNRTICDIVRDLEQDDRDGNTRISKYVTYSQRENIDKIDAYVNSKHTSGLTDALEREKPFFNIVTAARNIWYRATDIDRRNIRIKATKAEHYVLSFCATVLLMKWMRKNKFGRWLNEWGRTLATYGSAVSRFVEKDGNLVPEVIPWNRVICDPIDFDNNVKIIKLWLTPAQLRKHTEYDQEMVEDLITAQEAREIPDGGKVDSKDNYIELYEVYGEMPLAFLTEDEDDEDEYVEQFQVISFVAKKEKKADGSSIYDDFVLFKGKKKNCLRIDHLIKEDGRAMSIGAVEHLFEAQWMVNHNQKNIKDQLDITSKFITQTSDPSFVTKNVLNDLEQGDILIHKPQMPLTRVDNRPDITALQSAAMQWQNIANEITGTPEAMRGGTPKSGTAWRQTQAVLQESHSLFELMIENKGLALEEIMQEFVIPHLKKQMDTGEEIGEILESHHINKLDAMYIPNQAIKDVNKVIKEDILGKSKEDLLAGNLYSPEKRDEMIMGQEQLIKKSLEVLGNQRFIKPSDVPNKTWKKVLKDLEWELEVDVTGEGKDTEGIMSTLSTVLQTLAGSINPQTGQSMLLQDPNAKMVFNRILEETGALSAVEINSVESVGNPSPQPQPAPMAPPMQA